MQNSTNFSISSSAQQTLRTLSGSGYISGAQKAGANSAQPFSVRTPSSATSVHSLSKIEKLTDTELYGKCKYYGELARIWRQKFIGLLPEVNRRRLYEKKSFSSIFEFAFKLCGLSKEQVYLALNLERRFEDKLALKQIFENGEASINKLTRVVSIATPENEEELAEKIKILPQSALETWIRDEKIVRAQKSQNEKFSAGFKNQNGLNKPLFDDKGLRAQTLEFEIDDDIKKDLNELHTKGIDVNELLREMLKKRQEKIADKKEEIAKTAQPTKSRYIPAETRKILHEEFGEKCSIQTCQKPTEIIHHTQRFSLSQNHDPHFLAPLCREHHIIAHSIDGKTITKRLAL